MRLGPIPEMGDGWGARELELPGGRGAGGRLLAGLQVAGVTVSRFERIELPLADLLERVVSLKAGQQCVSSWGCSGPAGSARSAIA